MSAQVPEVDDGPSGSPSHGRAWLVALCALVAVAVTSALLLVGRSDARPSAAPAGPTAAPTTPTTATPTPATPTPATPTLAPFVVNLTSLAPGECVNAYRFYSVANAPRFTRVPCTDPAARMQFVDVRTEQQAKDGCSKDNRSYQVTAGRVYCYRTLLTAGDCVPAWTKKGVSPSAYFNYP